jgi:peptidoglycan/LPS O-acetylase OafA/YrhL
MPEQTLDGRRPVDEVAPQRPFLLSGSSTLMVLAAAVGGGKLLGGLDLVGQKGLPYPWANRANSSAVWALGAFCFGLWVRRGRLRAAVGGIVLLVVAVESYYLTTVLVQHDDIATLTAPTTFAWNVFGVVAGALFGSAGTWARSEWPPTRVAGSAMAAAVLFAEALVELTRTSGPGSGRVQTAALTAALGLILGVVQPSARQRVLVLLTSLPLAGLGYLGFIVAGFSG